MKFLFAWGLYGLVGSLWNIYVQYTFLPGSRLFPPPDYVNVVSGIYAIGGQLILYALVLYAVWRFWSESRTSAK